jgi:hypothetical protein
MREKVLAMTAIWARRVSSYGLAWRAIAWAVHRRSRVVTGHPMAHGGGSE